MIQREERGQRRRGEGGVHRGEAAVRLQVRAEGVEEDRADSGGGPVEAENDGRYIDGRCYDGTVVSPTVGSLTVVSPTVSL